MKRIALMAAILLLITACGPRGELSGAPESAAPPPSSPAFAGGEDAAGREGGLMRVLFGIGPGEVTAFGWYGGVPFTQTADGESVPELYAADPLLYCSRDAGCPYAAEDAALVGRLGAALDGIDVDPASKTALDGAGSIPEDEPLAALWLTLGDWDPGHGAWSPILFLAEGGSLYVDMNNGDGVYRFQAGGGEWYGTLTEEISAIGEAVDAMPVDHNLSVFASPGRFVPESEAVKLYLENTCGRAISFSPAFTVEVQDGDGWRALRELQPADASALRTVGPREDIRVQVDLTGLEGGQQPGRYRLSNRFSYADGPGGEAVLFAEYEIAADAGEVSYPLPPEMTPENADYCARYVEMWGFYNPLGVDFAAGGYPENFHTYHMYYILSGLEGVREEHARLYGADLPAGVVEGVISRHFNITAEEIRQKTPGPSQKPSEYYDPARGLYHFEGGYGGGSLTGVVTASEQRDGLLTLTCRWYGMDDGYAGLENVVQIRLDGAGGFVYESNRVTEGAGG